VVSEVIDVQPRWLVVVRSLVRSLVLEGTSERTTCRRVNPQPGAVCTRRQAEPTDMDVMVWLLPGWPEWPVKVW